MKTLKFAALALAGILISSATSVADHQVFEYRMNAKGERFGVYTSRPTTTSVAVYTHGHGVGRREIVRREPAPVRYQTRTDAKGHTHGVYAPER